MRKFLSVVCFCAGLFAIILGMSNTAWSVPGSEFCTPIQCNTSAYADGAGRCCYGGGSHGFCYTAFDKTCAGISTFNCAGVYFINNCKTETKETCNFTRPHCTGNSP